jgi:hypothetical protein
MSGTHQAAGDVAAHIAEADQAEFHELSSLTGDFAR